jgi:hypothetical protein
MTFSAPDRRRHHRQQPGEHGIVSARVRPGHSATVLDLSDEGALIELTNRLLPGAGVDLQLGTADRVTTIHGRVVRCAVIHVRPSSISYRAAIVFEYPVPTRDRGVIRRTGVVASPTGC